MHSTSGAWKEYSFQPRWRCCCERICSAREYRLEVRVAWDLAPDVANEPADAGAQNAQLSTEAVELFGMVITPCHHGGALGDAHIRLPQPHAALPGQSG